MSEVSNADLLAAAVEAAQRGGEVLRRYFRDPALEARDKARNDLVTRADDESEAAVVGALRERFPGHAVLAEEGGASAGEGYEWVVDPLDGTHNFVHGLPMFAVSIACRRGADLLAAVVLEPHTEQLYTATRGGGAYWNGRPMRVSGRPGIDGSMIATGFPFRAHQLIDTYLELFRDVFSNARAIRRCGAAALDLAHTASGVFDGMFEFALGPWDLAAGTLLIREAGGVVTDPAGGPDVTTDGHVIAGSPGVHADLMKLVRGLRGEQSLSERLAGL